jgi:hypothetical protein
MSSVVGGDVEAAFASGLNAGVDAFSISGGPLTYSFVDKVTALAARTGKPTVASTRNGAGRGCSYPMAPIS